MNTLRTAGRRWGGARAGFSLIEMLVVLIIIGLIAALVAPRVFEGLRTSKVKATRAQIELLAGAVEHFALDMGRVPTAQEGLAALLARPQSEDADKWRGPYLKKDFVPDDGWGHPFQYTTDDAWGFVIRSLGADGRVGGDGDNTDLDNRHK